jgi:hypothetical protein
LARFGERRPRSRAGSQSLRPAWPSRSSSWTDPDASSPTQPRTWRQEQRRTTVDGSLRHSLMVPVHDVHPTANHVASPWPMRAVPAQTAKKEACADRHLHRLHLRISHWPMHEPGARPPASGSGVPTRRARGPRGGAGIGPRRSRRPCRR